MKKNQITRCWPLVFGRWSSNALISRIVFSGIVTISLIKPSINYSQAFDILKYGRSVVDTLASPYFKGRGYIQEGDNLAAYFVASEFHKAGLKKFVGAKNYYQNFNFPVNTFPRDCFAAVDDNYMICGRDFVPDAGCPDIKGTWNLVWLDSATVADAEAYINFARRDFSTYF